MAGVFCVALIHVDHFGTLSTLADLASRWAVPFFFVVSGYFLTDKPLPQAARQLFKRLAIPFFFWTALYCVLSGDPIARYRDPAYLASVLLGEAPAAHLWFLPSLAVCSGLMLLMRRLPFAAVFAVAGGLYLVGLALGAYSGLLLGHPFEGWNMRNGPFFGLVFMAFGYWIARRGVKAPLAVAVSLFVVGAVMQAGEGVYLIRIHSAKSFDMVLGTIPFGVGAFLLARRFSGPIAKRLAPLGRVGLGIYAAHLLGLWLAYRVMDVVSFWSALLACVFAFVFAAAVSLLLNGYKFTRPLVA